MLAFFPFQRIFSCFNPLPLPKQGEMESRKDSVQMQFVSIRSPYRSKGRCGSFRLRLASLPVSIRSPYRSKGRCETLPHLARLAMFQSAPLTEARGDMRIRVLTPIVDEVSIRSPYRSKGRYTSLQGDAAIPRVSIRSPYRSKGRCAPGVGQRGNPPGFNPLPLPKQGEMWE